MSNVKVETGKEDYTQQVTARSHNWLADEPVDNGGSDEGPTPYEQLLGALGSCMVTTLQMYSQRKDWPLEKVEAILDHHRVHASDCRDCESEDTKVSEIIVELKITGDLDDEQRNRLLKIAGRCPVKRTLEGEIKVREGSR